MLRMRYRIFRQINKRFIMTKAQAFKDAYTKLRGYADADYMSNMDNWCIVHATKYMPRINEDGTKYIPSTAMATEFKVPRTTVHTTFNHVVTSHGYGSWDTVPIVVLAPYNDVVAKNGNPLEIATTDTYWSVDTQKGMQLPDSAYIIQPSDDVLFSIGEHGATYKCYGDYTDEEIQTILELIDPYDREVYNKYQNGDFQDYELENEFYSDERIKEMYKASKDKRAFLRGLFEESRFELLSHYLRNAVVRMAMDKMGFRELYSHTDGSNENNAVVKTAEAAGIPATAANKGHFGSIHAEMERFWENLYTTLNGSSFGRLGIIKTLDIASLSDYFEKNINAPFIPEIMNSIITNTSIDFFAIYEENFMDIIKTRKDYLVSEVNSIDNQIAQISSYNLDAERREYQTKLFTKRKQWFLDELQKLSNIKSMQDYDKNLSETFRKNSVVLSREFDKWRIDLSKQPEYANFVKKFKKSYDMCNLRTIAMSMNKRDI